MSDDTPPTYPISLSDKKAQRKGKSSTKPPDEGDPLRHGHEWWFNQFVVYSVSEREAGVNSLIDWCRKSGALLPGEPAPSQRTLQRWSSAHNWQERKQEEMRNIGDRALALATAKEVIRKVDWYENAVRQFDALQTQLNHFLYVYEVLDEEVLSAAERKKGKTPKQTWLPRPYPWNEHETRPTRERVRLPSEFGGRGNPYNWAGLERLVNAALAMGKEVRQWFPSSSFEQEVNDLHDDMKIVFTDPAQIAELGSKFSQIVNRLVEKTERKRQDLHLNEFGEPITTIEGDPVVVDEQNGPLEPDGEEGVDWEWVDVEEKPVEGTYITEEGEILPVGGPKHDEWDGGEE